MVYYVYGSFVFSHRYACRNQHKLYDFRLHCCWCVYFLKNLANLPHFKRTVNITKDEVDLIIVFDQYVEIFILKCVTNNARQRLCSINWPLGSVWTSLERFFTKDFLLCLILGDLKSQGEGGVKLLRKAHPIMDIPKVYGWLSPK